MYLVLAQTTNSSDIPVNLVLIGVDIPSFIALYDTSGSDGAVSSKYAGANFFICYYEINSKGLSLVRFALPLILLSLGIQQFQV